jgi:hypothetical protein
MRSGSRAPIALAARSKLPRPRTARPAAVRPRNDRRLRIWFLIRTSPSPCSSLPKLLFAARDAVDMLNSPFESQSLVRRITRRGKECTDQAGLFLSWRHTNCPCLLLARSNIPKRIHVKCLRTRRAARRGAGLSNADHLVRSSPRRKFGNLGSCKSLILNNHARGMSVAYPQPSRTKQDRVTQKSRKTIGIDSSL